MAKNILDNNKNPIAYHKQTLSTVLQVQLYQRVKNTVSYSVQYAVKLHSSFTYNDGIAGL